jgi:hypothetical protein
MVAPLPQSGLLRAARIPRPRRAVRPALTQTGFACLPAAELFCNFKPREVAAIQGGRCLDAGV